MFNMVMKTDDGEVTEILQTENMLRQDGSLRNIFRDRLVDALMHNCEVTIKILEEEE